MSELETRVAVSLEDGVLILRVPTFSRSMRQIIRDSINGQSFALDDWMRDNLAPDDRLAVLEIIDPPISGVAVEAARMRAKRLPADLSDKTFTEVMESWVKTVLKDDPQQPPSAPEDRLLWIVASEVRQFTRDCHPDLEMKFKAGHEHLHREAEAKFWSDCWSLVSFWVERSLDELWEDYLNRHGRKE
jgi:hypothetical protein